MRNEIIVLTPVLDVFSPIYKMKSTAEDNLQEEVPEWQNGVVVLDGNVAAIPIAEFSNTGKLCRIVHSLSLLLTRNLGSDAGESFISCMSLIKADFRYRRPGFLRAMLAWEYEIIPSSEGILIGQLSRVFHELQ